MADNKSAHDHLREKATDTTEAHDTSSAYATVADFMTEVKESNFTLSDEKPVKFRAIRPLDCQALMGNALTSAMLESGISREGAINQKSRQACYDQLPIAARQELILIDAQSLIVQASVQPKFSMLPVGICPPDKVPAELLSRDDTYNFRDAIESFSGVKQAEEEFRDDSETSQTEAGSTDAEGTGEPAADRADGEGVRAEPV